MRKAVFVALVMLIVSTAAFAQTSAKYSVTLTRTWTAQSHPFEYPESTLVSGPHFSGLIGATHNGAYKIYSVGAKPSRGLERLSEEGKHSPLDDEIKAAIAAGKAGQLFETGPIREDMGTETFTVMVDKKFPLVSAVAMIAPSPDWFAGAMAVNLMEGGKWVPKKTVDLFAYDSGGDDGATYKADDKDTNPKKATSILQSKHFLKNGNKVRVATLTFTKM